MRDIVRSRLALLLLVFATVTLRAETIAELKKPAGYIDDYAGVLSTNAKAQMESLCVELHGETKAQIFVVTIKSLEGSSIEEFSNNLFHNWGIGEKKTDRGALLLFAVKEHKYRYEIGYGLEGILNDAKVGDFGRAMVPDLRAGNYDDAARLGLREIAQVIADDAHVEISGLQSAQATTDAQELTTLPQDAPSSEQHTWADKLFLAPLLFLLAIVAFIVFVIVRAVRQGRVHRSYGSSSDSDVFMSSSSSNDDSSSSSDSFSGGDGGDSGGGGASGDW